MDILKTLLRSVIVFSIAMIISRISTGETGMLKYKEMAVILFILIAIFEYRSVKKDK